MPVVVAAAAAHAIRAANAAKAEDAFSKYDEDGSGAIDKTELLLALKDMGMEVSGRQASQILRKYLAASSSGLVGAGEDGLDKPTFLKLVDDLSEAKARAAERAKLAEAGTTQRAVGERNCGNRGESISSRRGCWNRGRSHLQGQGRW